MSSERRGVELLLDSMDAFRSALLRVMVAVLRRGLQRRRRSEAGRARYIVLSIGMSSILA